jgi:hypothetical protein
LGHKDKDHDATSTENWTRAEQGAAKCAFSVDKITVLGVFRDRPFSSPSFYFLLSLPLTNGGEGDPGKPGRSLINSKHNAQLFLRRSSITVVSSTYITARLQMETWTGT